MDQILILEDEIALRTAIARNLREQAELEVSCFGQLREAVASLEQRRPNLVILDLELPDGSGLDLLSELSQRELRIPVVVVSGHLGRFQGKLPDSSNVDILAKPVELSDLKALVIKRLEQTKRDSTSPGFAVADYLQLAGMARRSIVLDIRESNSVGGQIVVQEGEPIWAEDALGVGEAAFRRLALLARADVSCQALDAPLGKSNLSGSLEHLLIDAARYADEHKRPAAPSPASAVSPIARIAASPIAPPRPSPARNSDKARPSGTLPVVNGSSPSSTSGVSTPISVAAPRPPEVNQEKNVTPTKIETKSDKADLHQLLLIDSSLKAAARADRQGGVLETAGEMDAETACAVALMASHEVSEAAAEIGLGRPAAWHVSLGNSTWYIVHCREELVVTFGSVTKNPASTLSKVAKSCGV